MVKRFFLWFVMCALVSGSGFALVERENEWKYKKYNHIDFAGLAAEYWGLPNSRVENIKKASLLPDLNQRGLSNLFNHQWSHAYFLNAEGEVTWGDAHEDFNDNLIGPTGDRASEAWEEQSAAKFYEENNQQKGDWYLGYAVHYIVDASILVHCSSSYQLNWDLVTHHLRFESWIHDNFTEGHNFRALMAADKEYYEVSEPMEALHKAAMGASYWTSDLGRSIWDQYRNESYPSGVGSGSKELVQLVSQMMVNSLR
ncbi:MAG: hypothetical protein HQK52_14690 [Oligoflexia bacterium]|nr:hypothetical protein [Oligoflexia bacterium]